jgi:peptidoglycan/LPS O-acetylase OafA/YrhL
VAGGDCIQQAGEDRSARIESLRALAAIGVVTSHVYGATFAFGATVFATFPHRVLFGGGDGVWLFFVLTGYLLFWPFAKSIYADGAVDPRRYALNRALRILPLYYVAVVVFLLANHRGGSFGQWGRFVLFEENLSSSTLEKVDGVMWSLVIEVQFYALLPLLAWILARTARNSVRRAALLIGLVGSCSLMLRLALVQLAAHPHPLWQFSLPTTLFSFTAGMLLALGRLAWERKPPRWARGPVLYGDAWLLASLPFLALAFWRFNLHPLVAVAAVLVIGACVLPLCPGRLVRALEWRPLAALGVASYSLYIWHLPIVLRLGRANGLEGHLARSLAIELPLLIALAAVSYLLVERPFLRLRRRWSPAAPARDLEMPQRRFPLRVALARKQ